MDCFVQGKKSCQFDIKWKKFSPCFFSENSSNHSYYLVLQSAPRHSPQAEFSFSSCPNKLAFPSANLNNGQESCI